MTQQYLPARMAVRRRLPCWALLAALWLLGATGLRAVEVLPLEFRQDNTPFNFQSQRGVPISQVVSNPPGSDGRLQNANESTGFYVPPTTNQFRGFISFGGVAARTNMAAISNSVVLKNGTNVFSPTVALQMQLPVGLSNDVVVMVLRRAQVGAPYLSRQISYLYGSVIPVPDIDEFGAAISNKTVYWRAEPYTSNGHTNAPYYWSPNSREVYAIQPGPITVRWVKAQSSTVVPSDYATNAASYFTNSGNYFRIYTAGYIVSGSAVKKPRKIYWTEKAFQNLGKLITIPAARVAAVNIVYNQSFPRTVTNEFVGTGQSSPTDGTTNTPLPELRTLWFDQVQGNIHAYNQEGRAFLELLGDSRPDGQSRVQLAYEIVDVFKQVNPADVTIELGERVTPPPPGTVVELSPEPVLQPGSPSFAFQHNIEGSDKVEFYADRETSNLNDYMIHWMEQGEVGLKWPSLFARYRFIWPADATKYSHYARAIVPTETEAKLTAVPLPPDNVPNIDYQDPFDRPRAKLTEKFEFYSFLDPTVPVHRALVRLTAGERVSFERVLSWLDVNLTATNFANSIATNLSTWNTNTLKFDWSGIPFSVPRVVNQTVYVGQRIIAPAGELGSGVNDSYLAGYILQTNGTSFNPNAYQDPFVAGFEAANQGAIIPVNSIPGKNKMDIWWFRRSSTNSVKNESNGFLPIYWPIVIGHYQIQWPLNPDEIILASNDGSGALPSLQAVGRIYRQNDPAAVGYNPNEEHALMLGGQAYALRDDLNITSTNNYSSDPFVLLEFTDSDGRLAMRPFKVRREKPEAGILFDYIAQAGGDVDEGGGGHPLQAPMPLPFLPPPVEGSGEYSTNYNTEPSANSGDLPIGWTAGQASGIFSHYSGFTYRDRKDNFWVYRGLHGGLPALQAGRYNPTNRTFVALPAALAVVGQPFTNYIHTSRRAETLLFTATTPLPLGLRFDGLTITGSPTTPGSNFLTLVVTDAGDQISVSNTLSLVVATNGSPVGLAALQVVSTNQYSQTNVVYVGRPPHLADSPTSSNSFTMRYYYKTQEGFAWPNFSTPPVVGSIVPYLRPIGTNGSYIGDPTLKTTAALDIVYRPVWADNPPQLQFGESLMLPKRGLPAIRGQTSLKVLYQQSIGLNVTSAPPAVVLHDPTRQKTFALSTNATGLTKLPGGVRTDSYQGRLYFPNLPPHLAQRIFFDPNRGAKGAIVFQGQFVDDIVGDDYLLLNVLRGSDLATVKSLCPIGDPNKTDWDAAIDGLSTTVETFVEDPKVPGQYIPKDSLTDIVGVGDLAEVTYANTAVDSYALSSSGPGMGYVTLIAGNGAAFTPEAEPVSVYVIKVSGNLYTGQLKVMPSANPLNEKLTMQHTADLAGRSDEYEYEWKIAPPVDGLPPVNIPDDYNPLVNGNDIIRYTLGGNGIQVLVDNYLIMRYRPANTNHPLYHVWSEWTTPQLAEGWIKRVLAGINPFNQRVTDLFNNTVNTTGSILQQAGHRWEGDVALNLENINNFGLIEIYETVLRRGRGLSIDSGVNFGPANDALLLAQGYINDLYMMLGNEAYADSANPTIGVGTSDPNLGSIATALFAFKGQVPSLLEEELALLRGRDDFLQPGVVINPVYNRLYWNYTRGIDSGEVIYALNYNILDQDHNGTLNAADAALLYPQGHGDAYGHYLTALKGYYSLLMDTDFDWVPRTEAVTILGVPVQVDYLDERKFATAAAAVARTGRQIFDLEWRKDYMPGQDAGWQYFASNRVNSARQVVNGVSTNGVVRRWGLDHWAARTGQGAYLNWVVGNAILPAEDPNPSHEGIQKIDRTTVPELKELAATAQDLQTAMDNAESHLTPLGLPEGSLAFDINPNAIGSVNPGSALTHFEQIYDRASVALNNAVVSFDDAKSVTQVMRAEQTSLAAFQASVDQQERAYTNQLIEMYGTPYPEDAGPGKTYKQGYVGPDFIHWMYVSDVELHIPGIEDTTSNQVFKVDKQLYPASYLSGDKQLFDFDVAAANYTTQYITFELNSHGYFEKPAAWVSQRSSPGKLQQAIAQLILAHNDLYNALYTHKTLKYKLDRKMEVYESLVDLREKQNTLATAKAGILTTLDAIKAGFEIADKSADTVVDTTKLDLEAFEEGLPKEFIVGLASGGDLTSGARAALKAAGATISTVRDVTKVLKTAAVILLEKGVVAAQRFADLNNVLLDWDQTQKEKVLDIDMSFTDVQSSIFKINDSLRKLDAANDTVMALVAQAQRLQDEREAFRQRSAAVIQGYRTRDAAFRIFRNEKLERYKSLFDLASHYGYLAANAYDYETGLLGTDAGKSFLNRIVNSRALGIVRNGQPQFAGSDTGDPGLSSALAEMKADWDVIKGRLGFNNPDIYGTVASLRSESFRILPGTDGDSTWKDLLNRNRMPDILADEDVRRYCMQIDSGDGLPVPGIVVSFGTLIANGYNLFGLPLAAGDHNFSPSSFATKIYGTGVDLDGYIGMDNPSANSGAGGVSPGDPTLDPNALAATPYVYLIPVGLDSMRTPPLGDASNIRSWSVQDVTIPLPFNIGASDFSSKAYWQSSDSLSEALFSIRKFQAFRPVSSPTAFYNLGATLQASQFTNRRLIGRSVWNSQWKLVIPGRTLLANGNQGLDRFIQTVKDIKIYFVTYSYAGN